MSVFKLLLLCTDLIKRKKKKIKTANDFLIFNLLVVFLPVCYLCLNIHIHTLDNNRWIYRTLQNENQRPNSQNRFHFYYRNFVCLSTENWSIENIWNYYFQFVCSFIPNICLNHHTIRKIKWKRHFSFISFG